MGKIGSSNTAQETLVRKLNAFAFIIGLVTALAIPTLYFGVSYEEEREHLNATTKAVASTLTEITFQYPEMWRFLDDRLIAILQRTRIRLEHVSKIEIFDGKGDIVVESGTLDQSATFSASAEFGDPATPLGRVFISIDATSTVIGTALAAVLGLTLGAGMFLVLRIYPLKALLAANTEIKELNDFLEIRVEERTAALRMTQSELVRQERLATIGQLTATVSHELWNPLNAIRLSMDPIADATRELNLGLDETVARIERSISRCDNIIGEMLDFTRETRVNFEPTNLDEWLSCLLDEQVKPVGVVLHRDLAAAATPYIDRERLRRAVINIIDNAVQAVQGTDDHSEKIVTVSTKFNAGHVEIAVIDNGTGISENDRKKMFEPLFSTKSFGVGLGLTVVEKILNEHSGEIKVTSTVGEGTQFVLRIPLHPPGKGKN